jgi:hypothetical protein
VPQTDAPDKASHAAFFGALQTRLSILAPLADTEDKQAWANARSTTANSSGMLFPGLGHAGGAHATADWLPSAALAALTHQITSPRLNQQMAIANIAWPIQQRTAATRSRTPTAPCPQNAPMQWHDGPDTRQVAKTLPPSHEVSRLEALGTEWTRAQWSQGQGGSVLPSSSPSAEGQKLCCVSPWHAVESMESLISGDSGVATSSACVRAELVWQQAAQRTCATPGHSAGHCSNRLAAYRSCSEHDSLNTSMGSEAASACMGGSGPCSAAVSCSALPSGRHGCGAEGSDAASRGAQHVHVHAGTGMTEGTLEHGREFQKLAELICELEQRSRHVTVRPVSSGPPLWPGYCSIHCAHGALGTQI